jgi:hypothetical protein
MGRRYGDGTHTEPARLAASTDDYARFKLAGRHIEQWEDGIRLDPSEPNIEWWYFDSRLDDGAKLAVTFCHGGRGRWREADFLQTREPDRRTHRQIHSRCDLL